MAHALTSSARPKDARDLALLLFGRDLMARASELISLTVEMIRLQPDGTARVDLLRAKTHDESSVSSVYMLSAGCLSALAPTLHCRSQLRRRRLASPARCLGRRRA
jgi:hypothetical protein